LAVALVEETGLLPHNSLFFGLRTLLSWITENKGEYQRIEKHFLASLRNEVLSTGEPACALRPR